MPSLGKRVGEEGVGAAVEGGRRDDRVAGAGEVQDRERLGGLAARGGDGGDAPFEGGDAPLEDVRRRVPDPRVDVPGLPQAEEVGGVPGAVEDVGRRGVDGDGACVRGGVGALLPGVDGESLGAEGGAGRRWRSTGPWGTPFVVSARTDAKRPSLARGPSGCRSSRLVTRRASHSPSRRMPRLSRASGSPAHGHGHHQAGDGTDPRRGERARNRARCGGTGHGRAG